MQSHQCEEDAKWNYTHTLKHSVIAKHGATHPNGFRSCFFFLQPNWHKMQTKLEIINQKCENCNYRFFAGNSAIPQHQIECTIWIFGGPSNETLEIRKWKIEKTIIISRQMVWICNWNFYDVKLILTNGWSFLHALRSSPRRAIAIPDILRCVVFDLCCVKIKSKIECLFDDNAPKRLSHCDANALNLPFKIDWIWKGVEMRSLKMI